jgi:Na+-driven multidrug efflux pump
MSNIHSDISTITDDKNINLAQKENTTNSPNKLSEEFESKVKEDMTNFQLIKLIVMNSIFCICAKVLININDSITISFLGHLARDRLTPYFIASLIQNIGFKGIGYGFTSTSNMLAARHFGSGNLKEVGQVINRGKIICACFALIALIICLVGKGFFTLIFGDTYIDLIMLYLQHNWLSIFFNFQVTMQLLYLNAQNNYMFPAIIDSITTVTLFIVFKIFFSVYHDDIVSSDRTTFIITAWCLNLVSILQYLYYTLFIYIYKPSPGSNIWYNRESFARLGEYLHYSLHFVCFFLSHFLGGEQLNILLNAYLKDGSKYFTFDAYSTAQKVYFILQKITMGFSFVVINITGSLVSKGYFSLHKKFVKIYFIFSFSVIIIAIICVEGFANLIATIYTDKTDLLEYIPGYMRLISLIIIPYHFENSLQAIFSGYKKQKIPAYICISVTIIGGMGIGALTIFVFEWGVYGVIITTLIIEIILSVVNFIFVTKYTKEIYNNNMLLSEENNDLILQT